MCWLWWWVAPFHHFIVKPLCGCACSPPSKQGVCMRCFYKLYHTMQRERKKFSIIIILSGLIPHCLLTDGEFISGSAWNNKSMSRQMHFFPLKGAPAVNFFTPCSVAVTYFFALNNLHAESTQHPIICGWLLFHNDAPRVKLKWFADQRALLQFRHANS